MYYEPAPKPKAEPSPSPDLQQQVPDRETRVLGHAYTDILRAVEDGCFAVETPRVHVEQTDLQAIDIGMERDTKHVMGDIQTTPPYIVLGIDWNIDRERGRDLFSDLRKHAAVEGPCMLYGDMHVWRMEQPSPRKIELGAPHGGEETAWGSAEIEWRKVEPVGWI